MTQPLKCPKCHYERGAMDQLVNAAICPGCGIVYAKWLARQEAAEPREAGSKASPELAEHSDNITWREWLLYVPQNGPQLSFWPRLAIWFGFLLWGGYFLQAGLEWQAIGGSFLHMVNLPFHEFGHIFFSPLGRFMAILGGSLFQVLMPLGLMLVFSWQQRDNFAASLMLWWSGQNFIDVAPYIDDAQYRLLPLVGGGGGEESHDWGNLLTMMNALDSTHQIARSSFVLGALIMILALLWGGAVLRQQKHWADLAAKDMGV